MGRKGAAQGRNLAPTYRPSKEVLQTVEFVDYVRDVFKKNPNLPMFKVRKRPDAVFL
jgi:hypothetical protein